MAEQPVRTTGDRPGEAAMESTTASSDPEVHSADSQSDQPELSSSNADGMTDTVAEDGSGVDGTTANVADVALEDDKPKKKKRNKKTGKKRRHITGFEENFCDPPTTPAEAAEEQQLYAPEIPFAQRIEECIQRYRQKRKVATRNGHIFDKYLFFGGIQATQRQFGGMDADAIREATTDEIRLMTATDFIQSGANSAKFYHPKYAEGWVVDFEGVVKGFLSRFIPECFTQVDPETDAHEAGNIIRNFLNYVLHHDVCPEYTDNIKAAQAICQIAPDELRDTYDLYAALPDSFNTAARFLFCDGGIFKAYEPEKPASETSKDKKASKWSGYDMRYNPEELDAHLQLAVFRFNLMDKIKDEKLKETIYETEPREMRVVSTKTQAYKVVSTHRPNKRTKMHNEEMLKQQDLGGKIKPTGIALLRPTIIDHAWSNVPRPEEVDDVKQPNENFILDDDLLAKLKPGMKMQLVICELNIGGFRFVKECKEVRTSFDTLLPQSLMATWKDPVLNERPAPSASNPDVGHDDPAKMAEDDLEG